MYWSFYTWLTLPDFHCFYLVTKSIYDFYSQHGLQNFKDQEQTRCRKFLWLSWILNSISLCNRDSQTQNIKKKIWMTPAVNFNSYSKLIVLPLALPSSGNRRPLERRSITEKTWVDWSDIDPQGQRGRQNNDAHSRSTSYPECISIFYHFHQSLFWEAFAVTHSQSLGLHKSNYVVFEMLTLTMSACDVGLYCSVSKRSEVMHVEWALGHIVCLALMTS